MNDLNRDEKEIMIVYDNTDANVIVESSYLVFTLFSPLMTRRHAPLFVFNGCLLDGQAV